MKTEAGIPLPNDYDYARSFLQFTTDRTNHTPRLQVDASLRLCGADGAEEEYFLTAPCISETMYAAANLVQRPSSEFYMIASRDDEFMSVKEHASSAHDPQRRALRVGEVMPTHDGKGARMVRLEIAMRRFARTSRIESYEEIRDSILGNHPLNGRSTLLAADGQTRIVMEYPIKTCNIAHDKARWQIDTGPILVAVPAADGGLSITCLTRAHLVYNAWDWAEMAASAVTPIEGTAAATVHYSDIRRINVSNELFCLE
jgi:hypothetical protein